jgi:hypothetical protein
MKPDDNNGNLPTSQRLFEFSSLADGAAGAFSTGHPQQGSSPDEQQKLGLNEDVRLNPSKGEGEKLRE